MKRLIFLIIVLCMAYIFTGCPDTPTTTTTTQPKIDYSSSSSYEKYETYNGELWLIEEIMDTGDTKITFKYDYDSSAVDTYIDVTVTPEPDEDTGKCRYTFNQTKLSDVTTDRTFIVKDDLSGDLTVIVPKDGSKKTLRCKNMNADGSYSADNFVYETYYNFNGKRVYEKLYDDKGVLNQEKVDEYKEDGTTYVKEVFYYRNQTESVYTIKDIVFPEYNSFNKCIRENRQVVREMGGVNYDKYSYHFDWDPSGSFIVREAKYGYVSDSVNESLQISTWYNDTYETINSKFCMIESLHFSENKSDFFTKYTYDSEGNKLRETKYSYYYNNKINPNSKIASDKIWSRYTEGELSVVKLETRNYDLENQPDEPVSNLASIRGVIKDKLISSIATRYGKSSKIFPSGQKPTFYKD